MIRRLTTILLLATVSLPASVASAGEAKPAEVAALRAPIERFQAAFNAGQVRFPAGVFTPDAIVADGFAPFRWTGKGAAARWYAGLWGSTRAEQAAITARGQRLTVSQPHDVRIDGNHAYLVVEGENAWTEGGTPHFERAQWLITERRVGGRWLIASHSWAITATR